MKETSINKGRMMFMTMMTFFPRTYKRKLMIIWQGMSKMRDRLETIEKNIRAIAKAESVGRDTTTWVKYGLPPV